VACREHLQYRAELRGLATVMKKLDISGASFNAGDTMAQSQEASVPKIIINDAINLPFKLQSTFW